MIKYYKQLLKNIEKKVGLSIEKIKSNSPEETREYLIKKNKYNNKHLNK